MTNQSDNQGWEPYVKLFDGNEGETNVHISASIRGDGDLSITGSDFGAAPKAIFKSSEYEYFLTVKAANKKRLLSSLLGIDSPNTGDDDRALLEAIEMRWAGHPEAGLGNSDVVQRARHRN